MLLLLLWYHSDRFVSLLFSCNALTSSGNGTMGKQCEIVLKTSQKDRMQSRGHSFAWILFWKPIPRTYFEGGEVKIKQPNYHMFFKKLSLGRSQLPRNTLISKHFGTKFCLRYQISETLSPWLANLSDSPLWHNFNSRKASNQITASFDVQRNQRSLNTDSVLHF